MKDFFSVRVGDVVVLDGKEQKVIGKSLGRNWMAIRTTDGLTHVNEKQIFEVKKT